MSNTPAGKTSIGPKLAMAAVTAVALLVAFVLPAEHGVDPTGVGKLLGINALASTAPDKAGTDFGQILTFNVEDYDMEAEEINRSIRGLLQLQDTPFKTETIVLEIEDLGEIEHKFVMPEFATLVYSWRLLNPEGEGVYYEFHGHPSSADASNYPDGFEMAYSKGEGMRQNGSFSTPFSGYHGWYFMNLETKPVTIEMKVSGYYTEHKEMYRAVDGEVTNNVEF